MRNFLDVLLQFVGFREAVIIKRYYGYDGCKPQNFTQIGKDLGISPQRTNDIFRKAFVKRWLPIFTKKALASLPTTDTEGYMMSISREFTAMVILSRALSGKYEMPWFKSHVKKLHIEDLRGVFSVRLGNCLLAARIETLGDLENLATVDLLKYRNLGYMTLGELVGFLTPLGIYLKGTKPRKTTVWLGEGKAEGG